MNDYEQRIYIKQMMNRYPRLNQVWNKLNYNVTEEVNIMCCLVREYMTQGQITKIDVDEVLILSKSLPSLKRRLGKWRRYKILKNYQFQDNQLVIFW